MVKCRTIDTVPIDKSGLDVLTDAESFELLATMPIGRVAYSDRALPIVVPVTFVFDGTDIVIRTQRRSRLVTQAPQNVVAFEVDDIDIETRSGWSVVVVGRFELVEDPDEIRRLDELELHSWAPAAHDKYLKLRPDMISGRRIVRGNVPTRERVTGAATSG